MNLPLALLTTAVLVVSMPVFTYADETTAAVETAEASEEAANDSESEVAEEEAGETAAATTEAASKLAKEAGLPDGVHYANYFVLVSEDSGATMIQEPVAGSPVSINLTIPKGTLLHIIGEVIDANGHAWGYTNYADLRGGFLDMTTLTRANVQSAKEAAEEKISDPWGDLFTQVDGAGTPVSFNAVGKEELENAEESREAAEGDDNITTVETNADGETISGGSGNVIDASLENNETKEPETDENGEIIETEEEEAEETDQEGGFHVLSYILGLLTVIVLEVLLVLIMLILRKMKEKKRRKAEAAAEGADGSSGDEEPKKKKGFSLKLPKIKITKKNG